MTSNRSSRFHQLDKDLEKKLIQPLVEIEDITKNIKQIATEVATLWNLSKVAQSEVISFECAEQMPATVDLIENCAKGISDLQRVVVAIATQIDNTRRFVASIGHAHHDSIMPHLSDEEIECIKQLNPFVVKASNE